jgi:hypothetical protein
MVQKFAAGTAQAFNASVLDGPSPEARAADVRYVDFEAHAESRRSRVRDHRSSSNDGALYEALDDLDGDMARKLARLERLAKDPEKNQGAMIKLQNEISMINRAYEIISNIFKAMSDVQRTSGGNIN